MTESKENTEDRVLFVVLAREINGRRGESLEWLCRWSRFGKGERMERGRQDHYLSSPLQHEQGGDGGWAAESGWTTCNDHSKL